MVPPEVKSEHEWRALKVEGPLDFALIGILSSLLTPLAKNDISVFTVSTFDTDYILLKQDKLVPAIQILKEQCGCHFQNEQKTTYKH